MAKRYYRRRKQNHGPILVLLLLFIVAGSTVLAAPLSSSLIWPLLIGASVCLIAIGLIIVGLIIRQRNLRLRALTLADVDHMTGEEFEKYVAKLLESQGYKTKLTKTTADFGSDILAYKNRIGTAVQCKCYSGTVGIEAVYQAVGAMRYYKCSQCMAVTNNYFTRAAKELAEVNDCAIVDRDKLSQWIVSFQNGK